MAPLLALLFDILSFPMIFQAAFDKNETAYESVKSITNDTEYDAAIAHILEMVRIDRHYRG